MKRTMLLTLPILFSTTAFAEVPLPGRTLIQSDFAQGTNGWKVTNAGSFLTISATNRADGAALVFANENRKGSQDAAYTICSDFFAVEPGTEFAAVIEARGDVSMLGAYTIGAVATGVLWYDQDRKPVLIQDAKGKMVPSAFEFGFESLGESWCKTVNRGQVPESARFAKIQVGGAEPDIPRGQRVEIRRVAVQARVAGASWDFGDLDPPSFKRVSMSPNPDPNGEIRIRISDASDIDWATFSCLLDGADVTEKAKGSKEFVLKPEKPWEKDSLHVVKLDARDVHGNRRKETLALIEACEKIGMKLVVEAYGRDYKSPNRPAHLREAMLHARDYTCMLAWGLGDDTANFRTGVEIRDDDNIIKAIDNARLTSQADITTYSGRYRPYVHSTDVIMSEIYPFKKLQQEPAGLANVVRYMKIAMEDKKAMGDPVKGIWPLVQAFKGWSSWKRYPTTAEIRAQTYLGIIHGGRGVTYYTYYSGSKGAEGVVQHMDSFGSVTKELQAIYDDLTSYDAKEQPKVEIAEGPVRDLCGNPSVTCLLKEGAEGKGAWSTLSARARCMSIG